MSGGGDDVRSAIEWLAEFVEGKKYGERYLKALTDRLAAAEDTLRDVANSGVEFNDERVGYVAVQIDRDTWDACRRLVEPR